MSKRPLVGLAFGVGVLAAIVILVFNARSSAASPVMDSLWLGNDSGGIEIALHVALDGSVINSVTEAGITGFAYDGHYLYSAFPYSMQITRRSPADGSSAVLLAENLEYACASVCEDMAFGGGWLWRVEHGNTTLYKIDPITGAVASVIPLVVDDPLDELDPLGSYGIAWDGSKLWLSYGRQTGPHTAGLVMTYNVETNTLTPQFRTEFTPGGLAFGPDGNLWIGSFENHIHKVSPGGATLSSIIVPDQGFRFIDGLEYIPAEPGRPMCNGLPATIVGSDGDDILVGTMGADVIVGMGGNDIISGLAGNDAICGGPGNDIIMGNQGADWLDGGDGNDIIGGGMGDDTLYGRAGADILMGAEGNDMMDGGPGDDMLRGGGAADISSAEVTASPNDRLNGGAGSDMCLGGGKASNCE